MHPVVVPSPDLASHFDLFGFEPFELPMFWFNDTYERLLLKMYIVYHTKFLHIYSTLVIFYIMKYSWPFIVENLLPYLNIGGFLLYSSLLGTCSSYIMLAFFRKHGIELNDHMKATGAEYR